jgi:esterase/lipase superfamily enzyme
LNLELYTEKEDPREHFTIRELSAVPLGTFIKAGSEQAKQAKSFKDQALVFVHGFNTSFDDALYRAAQITYDIGFDGASYVFSWPSQGVASGYLYDRDSVDYSIKQFVDFLDIVARKTGAKQVNVLAHSMGARLVIDALLPPQEEAEPMATGRLKHVILVAADADKTVFEQRAHQHKNVAETMTLYANDNDTALEVSKKFSGGVPRVGSVPGGIPTIVEGSDTIDVSEATNWVFLSLHHNTYAEARHILRDIAVLMRQGTRPPNMRSPVTYKAVDTVQGRFWKYVSN